MCIRQNSLLTDSNATADKWNKQPCSHDSLSQSQSPWPYMEIVSDPRAWYSQAWGRRVSNLVTSSSWEPLVLAAWSVECTSAVEAETCSASKSHIDFARAFRTLDKYDYGGGNTRTLAQSWTHQHSPGRGAAEYRPTTEPQRRNATDSTVRSALAALGMEHKPVFQMGRYVRDKEHPSHR